MIMSVVGDQPKKKKQQQKKNANPSSKATKHIERTFLISDYLILVCLNYYPRKI